MSVIAYPLANLSNGRVYRVQRGETVEGSRFHITEDLVCHSKKFKYVILQGNRMTGF